MLVQRAQNAAATKLIVTSTATSLFDLMNAAGATSLDRAGFRPGVNGIDIKIENGDIRYLDDGNTPTSTDGVLGASGECIFMRHTKLEDLKFIAVTDNVNISVRVGICEREESSSVALGGSSSVDNEDLISTTATYTSLTLTNADTEYTYTLTGAAKQLEIINEECNTIKFNLNGSSGDSATDYILIKDGSMYWRPDMNLSTSDVLRFQSSVAGQVLRIALYN